MTTSRNRRWFSGKFVVDRSQLGEKYRTSADWISRHWKIVGCFRSSRGPIADKFPMDSPASSAPARGRGTVVDAALTSWARLIVDFGFSGGITSYAMTISMATTGTSAGAQAGPTAYTALGKPFQGNMTIGRGGDGPDVDVDVTSDGVPDPVGDGVGYFLDPTPFDSSEFTDHTNNAFAAYAGPGSPAFNQNDLYELVLHEMGHAVGLLPTSSMSSLSTNTFNPDAIDTPLANPPVVPAIGSYWRFNGGKSKPLSTSYDSGGGDYSAFRCQRAAAFCPGRSCLR